MLVLRPADRPNYAMNYAPRQAQDFHPFRSDNYERNLAWENVIERLCRDAIAKQGCTCQQVKEQHSYSVQPCADPRIQDLPIYLQRMEGTFEVPLLVL